MSTAIAKKPLRQVTNVKELLYNDQARDQLAAVAAKHLRPERMMRVVNNAIRTTPKLAECEPMSFMGALMQCASLGLEPNTVLGHAYLVPFKNNKKKVTEVQLIVGYKGLIDLARRSGHITSISAHIHYSDDEFWDYEEGTEARLRHRPGPQNGDKLHAYAIAQFRDGGHAYIVLPWAHVIKVRNQSQGWQTAVRFNTTEKSPWHTHEDAMAKKTAIRALSKYLPLSVEFMDAIQVDHDTGAHADFAGMALNPEEGPIIDGDYQDSEADDADEDGGEELEDKPQNEKPKPKPPAKKADPKAAAQSQPAPQESEDPTPPEHRTPDQQDRAPEQKQSDTHQDQSGPSDEEAYEKLVQLLTDELNEATDAGGIEAVLEMFEDQIGPLEGTEAHAQIMAVADERREAVA